MITIDLITGFLGAGKTTFIRKYATHLMEQGLNIGILENDHGAVNVDAMLLQDILGEHCTLEMVAGGCDADCHKRRFKTKLIAMGMCGYDRILVEPSGIFDMDEFFDVLHEDPLERWYTIGNVITIVDVSQPLPLSETSRYLLASQASEAGTIIFSHMDDANDAHKDIEPYMDSVFENNVLLTQTERLMMSGRPKEPKYARNKNILVIGGSGSGKTRFFVKPNLMQMHSSYVVTDPKGTVLVVK